MASQHHRRSPRENDNYLSQLQKMGAPAQALEKEQSRTPVYADDFIVLPENWLAVEIFISCAKAIGALSYIPTTEIESAQRMLRVHVADRFELANDVRLIETGFLEQKKKWPQTKHTRPRY